MEICRCGQEQYLAVGICFGNGQPVEEAVGYGDECGGCHVTCCQSRCRSMQVTFLQR